MEAPKPNNCSLPFCPSSSSPQARNDFELRRLMELDPSFAGVAGPEEARRNSVHSYGVAFEHRLGKNLFSFERLH